MRFRSLSAWAGGVALVLSMLLAGPAQAGLIVKLTATGTISSGSDDAGQLTGTSGLDLAGAQVTMVQTLEAGSSAFIDVGSNPSLSSFDLVALSVTVGSAAGQSFSSALGGGLYGLDPGSTLLDSQMTILLGTDTINSIISLISSQITGASPLQAYNFAGSFGQGSFFFGERLTDGGDTVWQFTVDADGMRSVTVEVFNTVPEPGVALLLLVALLAAVAVRSRRSGQPVMAA